MTAAAGVDVKICGIRTTDDFNACRAAGAAFVGMVFFPRSPRHLSMQEARTLSNHADRSPGGPARVAGMARGRRHGHSDSATSAGAGY